MSLSQEVDDSVRPGDDFYAYVNNKWLKTHPIPDHKAHVGAMSMLSDENLDKLTKLLAARVKSSDSIGIQAVKRFYHAAMDRKTIERIGLTPIQLLIDAALQLSDRADIERLITKLHAEGSALLWYTHLDIDDKNSQKYCLRISQSGLGLPDRDYYFETDAKFKSIRLAYTSYLTQLLTLVGIENPKQMAKAVYDLEKKLAAASDTALERRDVVDNYNPHTLHQLITHFPDFEWQTYQAALNFPANKKILVSQPKFLREAIRLLGNEPIETWRAYCLIRIMNPLMSQLPKVYDELYFDFYGKILGGAQKQEVRSRRIVHACIALLPEPTGQLFIDHYFDSQAKATITELVDNIKLALKGRIERLDWMSETTKRYALEKLGTFLPLLGYPDTWRDYSGLVLDNVYVSNVLATKAYEWQYDMHRSTQAVDRKEWLMSPAMVNAYYWPNTNGITFPAGILQPPLFDAHGDFAANYGAIGVVIGHEITHGFDDKGALFDKIGKLKSWWQPKDWQAFERRSKKLANQYSQYEIEGRKLNGELTLGENIADLGGTLIAFDAMCRKIQSSHSAGLVDGFTPEQRFFMSLARIWRENMRPELALNLLVSNPHAPSKLRVNGVVPNVDAFYDAFHVTRPDKLYKAPDDRVRIW